MVLDGAKEGFIAGYNQFLSILPVKYQPLINLLVFAILIAIYSIFTWHFYRNLSKRDILELNLTQYNKTTHPLLNKLYASLLNILEYLIILPFLIFFWFAIFALIILIMSQGQTAVQVVTIAAAIVAAIRILSYYSEDLSAELAKLFPLTMLTIFVVTPNFFSLDRILSFVTELPEFVSNIFYYLIFIAVLELILRVIDTLINFSYSEESSIASRKAE